MKGVGERENRLHAETRRTKTNKDLLRFQQVSAMTWLALQSRHYQTPGWTVMRLTHVSADSRGGLLMKDVLIIDQAVPTSIQDVLANIALGDKINWFRSKGATYTESNAQI